MDKVYAVPSAPPAAPPSGGYSPNDPGQIAKRRAIKEASNAKEINDLVNNLNVEIVSTGSEAPTVPAPRGSLADSIAKSTTVTQEPIPDPRSQKPSGPSRI